MFLLHPLSGNGSAFYGGIGSDVTIATAFLGSMVMFLRRHNCHVHRCWRLQWHPDPVSGHPICKHHHPESGSVLYGPPPPPPLDSGRPRPAAT